jgi:[ribosomal protein S5]-alanine N-acetyltransferase
MLSVNFTPFPVLQTERLILRETSLRDVSVLFQMRSDPEVMQYIDRPIPKSEEEIVALVELIQRRAAENEGISWAISLRDDPTFIGTISFHRLIKENYRAEVGYMLHPAHQGKGIMNEALKAVVAYGFNALHFHSIEAIVTQGNAASVQLLERNGFVKEAHFREDHFCNGKFVDTLVFCQLNPGRQL